MAPMPPMPPMPPVAVPPTGAPPPMTAHPMPPNQYDSLQTTSNAACSKRLTQLNIDPAPKVYVKPNAPGTAGREFRVQTNVFGIEIEGEKMVYRYMVHTKADLATNKEVVFTKKGKEDFVVLDRHEKCCDLFNQALQNSPDFFQLDKGNQLIYDGQSLLFSTIDLFPDVSETGKKSKLFEIDGSQTKNPDLQTLKCISLEVYAGKLEPIKFNSEEVAKRTADSNITANDRFYSQFMELALNQTCIKESSRFGCFEHGKVYFLNPAEEGFYQSDCVGVGDGKSLVPGLKKTIEFIEGPFGRGQNNPSVVIDAMKAAFHNTQTVYNKIGEILQKDPANGLSDFEREKAQQVIKGLDCNSSYTGRTRHLRIEGIHHDTATKARFELKDGKSCTVVQYYAEKYNIQLKYPNANLLVCKERANSNYYPIELMYITKNQRVTIPQQTGAQSQKTTKECAVLPDVRQRLIVTGKNAIDVTMENPLLQELGIKVYPEPLIVSGRELEGKDLLFGGGRNVKTDQGKWRTAPGNYLKPAAVPQVWAAYAVGTSNSRFTGQNMQNFIQQFIEACQKKGMNVGPPAEYPLVGVDMIEEKLMNAIKSNCKFCFVITDDNITHLHQRYKLLEREHEMIIQDMKMSKAFSVVAQGKRLTLENVVHKTNIKLGGLNYAVNDAKKSMTEDQLIIGVGVSAPPPGTKYVMESKGQLNPMIVGYASNAVANHEFCGDFLLAPAAQDAMGSIEDVVKNSLEQYEKIRKALPKRVIVYRSGASEGAHPSIVSLEIPLARAALREIAPEAKLIYLVVTKDHTFRFFKDHINTGAKATEMNIPPGIVLDTGVTNPACKQFFLNSHTTLQGSAKSPLFTVLADDCNAPLDRLEELTYTLCHHHQIVSLTTSLPTPLYVANEYAKRGRALWVEKSNSAPMGSADSERERLNELTKELSYKYTLELSDKRVNA